MDKSNNWNLQNYFLIKFNISCNLENDLNILKKIYPDFCEGKRYLIEENDYENFYKMCFEELMVREGEKYLEKYFH